MRTLILLRILPTVIGLAAGTAAFPAMIALGDWLVNG